MSTQTSASKAPAFSTRSLVTMAIFVAILCISAYISIPLPLPGSPHITMLNFVILLIALLFPVYQSFLIILVWMILGMLGLPVFIAGGSSIGYLLAPYGGYTVTFLLIAVLAPLLRGRKYNRIRYTAVSVFCALLIDFLGMLWLMVSNSLTWQAAFTAGFLAFLPLDLLKSVVAAQVIPAFRRITDSNN